MPWQWIIMVVCVVCLVACAGEEGSPALKADAGQDFALKIGETPRFNACASEGEIENYQWSVVQAPASKAEDANKLIRELESNCEFSLEDAMVIEEVGEWVIQLEVRAKDGSTATDTVTITVSQ
jgi:hypothetical protein